VGRPDEVNDYCHVKKGGIQMNERLDKNISRRTLHKGAVVATGVARRAAA